MSNKLDALKVVTGRLALREILRDGPILSRVVKDRLDAAGVDWRYHTRLKAELEVGTFVREKKWMWALPEHLPRMPSGPPKVVDFAAHENLRPDCFICGADTGYCSPSNEVYLSWSDAEHAAHEASIDNAVFTVGHVTHRPAYPVEGVINGLRQTTWWEQVCVTCFAWEDSIMEAQLQHLRFTRISCIKRCPCGRAKVQKLNECLRCASARRMLDDEDEQIKINRDMIRAMTEKLKGGNDKGGLIGGRVKLPTH